MMVELSMLEYYVASLDKVTVKPGLDSRIVLAIFLQQHEVVKDVMSLVVNGVDQCVHLCFVSS